MKENSLKIEGKIYLISRTAHIAYKNSPFILAAILKSQENKCESLLKKLSPCCIYNTAN